MRIPVLLTVVGLAGGAVLFAQLRAGADPGDRVRSIALGDSPLPAGVHECTPPSTGPDVIVGSLSGFTKWGTVGSITGYSIGAESCNIGDAVLLWDQDTNKHPVIGANLYRIKDGRFEQLGMSWLKHGFSALTLSLCCPCNNPGNSQVLGIGCSDPYGSGLNGDQNGFNCGGNICGGLGPRSEVNATKGIYAYPYGSAGLSGNAIYKRLQIHNDDLNPALNDGAVYWAEIQYVSPDDASAGNHFNNVSRRQVFVGAFSGGGWTLFLSGATFRKQAAIFAWADAVPDVTIVPVDDLSGGQLHLGYRVSDNGDGTWHYEYALHNQVSDRSAREFIVPIDPGVTVSNMGFHDVDYHSGEPYALTDWAKTVGATECSWTTDTFAADENANALRWGTVYTYRFDADAPPQDVDATIGLFTPGATMSVTVATQGPGPPLIPCPWDCSGDNNGVVDTMDFFALIAEWGFVGSPCDFDGNGVNVVDFFDLIGHWGPCP